MDARDKLIQALSSLPPDKHWRREILGIINRGDPGEIDRLLKELKDQYNHPDSKALLEKIIGPEAFELLEEI